MLSRQAIAAHNHHKAANNPARRPGICQQVIDSKSFKLNRTEWHGFRSKFPQNMPCDGHGATPISIAD
jgi:hypothetical protein